MSFSTAHSNPGEQPPRYAPDSTGPRQRISVWVGWMAFAALMMVISGTFSVMWGIVGIVRDQVFVVGKRGNLIALDYTAWGWITLILGLVVLISGLFLLTGSRVAAAIAVVVAALSAIEHLFILPSYPIWSVMVIAVNVMVIYAITVHGGELRRDGM